MPQVKCPICQGLMFRTDLAENVCRLHENYLITTCSDCKRTCFSISIHLCHQCGNVPDHLSPKGSTDKRAILRAYGLEGWK